MLAHSNKLPHARALKEIGGHKCILLDSIKYWVKQARESLAGASISKQQIADSVTTDAIQCLEDGTWHVMLKRYIKRKFNLTPQQYREKWRLPMNYPFVAENYSKKRSKIAKKMGLGRKRK